MQFHRSMLTGLKNSLVVVGVIGRSSDSQANKMSLFAMRPNKLHEPADGQILCYYKPGTNTLILHFETTYDEEVMSQQLLSQTSIDFDNFYYKMRSQFLRNMLLALHVCHIVVYVETAEIFDTTLVTIGQLLKYVREQHVLEFLPQMLQETSVGAMLGDRARLCTPRMLFLFENYPRDEEKTRDHISGYEFKTEDEIYQLLSQYNILTNNVNTSLVALPNNKQFVFYNAHEELHPDQFLYAMEAFTTTLNTPETKEEDEDSELISLAPFEGFVKPFGADYKKRDAKEHEYKKTHTAWHFLQRHVQDALQGNFDEGSFKLSPQTPQFQLLSARDWHICMAELYRLLIENVLDANYVTDNTNYVSKYILYLLIYNH